MIEIVKSSSFLRAYKRRICGNPDLERLLEEKLNLFVNNPFTPALKTHKLKGKMKDSLAFSLNFDLRVVFSFMRPNVALLENIGPHDDVYE